MPGVLQSLLVPIRASADQWSADLKKIQRDAKALENGLKPLADPLKTAGKEAQVAGEKLTHSFADANNAARGLEQMIGVRLPQSVNRFLAESSAIGPILASAFSAVAILGMIQALTQLPALYKKMQEAVTGWNDAAKKAFDEQLEKIRKNIDAMHEFEQSYIDLQKRLGMLTGVQALEQQIQKQKTLLHVEQDNLKAIEDEIKRRKELASKTLGGQPSALSLFVDTGGLEAAAVESRKAITALNEELEKLKLRMVDVNAADTTESFRRQTEAENEFKKATKAAADVAKEAEEARKKQADADARQILALRNGMKELQLSVLTPADFVFTVNGEVVDTGIHKIEDLFVHLEEVIANFRSIEDQFPQNAIINPLPMDTLDAALDGLNHIREEGIKATHDWSIVAKSDGEKVINFIADDISRMFTGMIAAGQTFWEAFKNLGRTVVASIADVFLNGLIKSVLEPFKDAISHLAKSIGGLFGGEGKKLSTGDVIGIAIAGVTAFAGSIAGLFGKLRKEANEFVQTIQNPMGDAVANLFNSLEAARALGTLTEDQVEHARYSFEKLWTDFQTQANAAGIVGQQALATMTPFIESWRTWLDSLDAAGRELEDQARTMGFKSQVTDAAFGMDNLNIAISELQDSGVSASAIVEYLGDDVKQFVTAAKLLNIEIPAAVAGIYDLMHAMERLAEIDRDLESTMSSLADAFNRKLDMLESAINSSQQAISDWSNELVGIYKKFTEKRADMEKEIVSLEDKIQRNALVKALDRAKKAGQGVTQLFQVVTEGISAEGHHFSTLTQTTKEFSRNQAAIDSAQAALDAFDETASEKANKADIDRLNYLKTNLPGVIQAQTDAATTMTALGIAIPLEPLAEELQNAKDRTKALGELIPKERLHLAELYKNKDATEAVMKAMGIARTNEWDDVNNSIFSLQARGALLESEGNAIKFLNPELGKMTHWFENLGLAMTKIGTESIAPIRTSYPVPPEVVGPTGVNPFRNFVPAFQQGTDFVPYTGLFQLHKGEQVIPEGRQQPQTVQLIIQGDVLDDDKVRKILRAMNRLTDKGSVRSVASEVRR